jgi:hypothetical protein
MKAAFLLCFFLSKTILSSQCISQDRWKEFDEKSFHYLKSYHQVPKKINTYINKLSNYEFKFDKNRKSKNRFDVPKRILAFAGKSNDTFIVHYEHGGRASHTHTLVILYENGIVTSFCNYNTPNFKSIESLIEYIKNNISSLEALKDL